MVHFSYLQLFIWSDLFIGALRDVFFCIITYCVYFMTIFNNYLVLINFDTGRYAFLSKVNISEEPFYSAEQKHGFTLFFSILFF